MFSKLRRTVFKKLVSSKNMNFRRFKKGRLCGWKNGFRKLSSEKTDSRKIIHILEILNVIELFQEGRSILNKRNSFQAAKRSILEVF